ncbi:hypothetical protein HYPSUDRAFT_208275, partial [Hypholoma sublateritium FD-334 SS-4]
PSARAPTPISLPEPSTEPSLLSSPALDAPRALDRLAEALRAHDAARGLGHHDIGADVRALRDELRDLAAFLNAPLRPRAPPVIVQVPAARMDARVGESRPVSSVYGLQAVDEDDESLSLSPSSSGSSPVVERSPPAPRPVTVIDVAESEPDPLNDALRDIHDQLRGLADGEKTALGALGELQTREVPQAPDHRTAELAGRLQRIEDLLRASTAAAACSHAQRAVLRV